MAFADHVPETEEYGVASYVYRARQPFIPEKILSVLDGDLPGVIRAKGHFWIVTRPEWVAEYLTSRCACRPVSKPIGHLVGLRSRGTLARPRQCQRGSLHAGNIGPEPWGDRRQELVFIGSGH